MSRACFVACTLAVLACLAVPPDVLAWNNCVKPPDGLVGWWTGDGNAKDIVGGNDGTLINGATFSPGEVRQAFALNGVDQWVSIPNAPSLNFATSDFTVDLWVNFNTTDGAEQVLVEKWVQKDPGRDSFGWTFTKPTRGDCPFPDRERPEASCFLVVLDGQPELYSKSVWIQPRTWYHVAARRHGRVVTIMLNGAVIASRTEPAVVDVSSSSTLKFGHRGNPRDTPGSIDESGFYLNGRIDEVELFNRALSDLEITWIYEAGHAGKCIPIRGTVNGIELEDARCQGARKPPTKGVISKQSSWDCTKAGLVAEPGQKVEIRLKGDASETDIHKKCERD